ncbi:MAG: hypothetical protein K8R54_04735 [Bacteroidales bacterium]|nr:hypothetical protein [Bacteroidales bacterium]
MENKTQKLNSKKALSIYLTFVIAFILLFFFFIGEMSAQVYNKCAAQNAVYEETVDDATGEVRKVRVEADRHGNAEGNQYDLAVDGAFQGETVAVLHLYTGEGFDFSLPKAALKEKGFSVYRWINNPPSPEELEKSLEKACQLWIISSNIQKLNKDHLKVIKKFFDSGKGVYIWGDNDPYYADANYVSDYLIGVKMLGNLPGNEVVGLNNKKKKVGLAPGHLITTGLEYVYEGITIATLQDKQQVLQPLIYGHESNLVTATYEQDGKRLILDGGFTRLYCSWDHAGTGRYVKNAAAWLVNYERFAEKADGL